MDAKLLSAFLPPTIAPVTPLAIPSARPATGESGFGNVLAQAVQGVERTQQEAGEQAMRFLRGEGTELHEVALATQKAELALDLFLETRSKVVQAYQEVMRMQI